MALARESYWTTPEQQQAARDMYEATPTGELRGPRPDVRLLGCKDCRARPHAEHWAKAIAKPLLWCAHCDSPTRHEPTRSDGGRELQWLWNCADCGAGRRWG